jgi:hypothetical protein
MSTTKEKTGKVYVVLNLYYTYKKWLISVKCNMTLTKLAGFGVGSESGAGSVSQRCISGSVPKRQGATM